MWAGYRSVRRVILGLALFASACSGSSATAATPTIEPLATAPRPATEAREAIVVPLSLHVVVEAGVSESERSTNRTVEGLAKIADDMAEIWSQADVTFDPLNITTVEMPTDVLNGILLGNTEQFFAQVNTTFFVEHGQAINGFYVQSAFGLNGFTPQGSNLFFVVDEPSVPDARVSSHEVGHIFGLRHDLDDANQLMFSGTDGTGLSELEQTVARYSVQGLFPQDIDP